MNGSNKNCFICSTPKHPIILIVNALVNAFLSKSDASFLNVFTANNVSTGFALE